MTTTQQEISAKISGDLWSRQMLWNQKRDFYVDILGRIHDLQTRCDELRWKAGTGKMTQAEWDEFLRCFSSVRSVYALASIFATNTCVEALKDFFGATAPDGGLIEPWLEEMVARTTWLTGSLIVAAKTDLGISE